MSERNHEVIKISSFWINKGILQNRAGQEDSCSNIQEHRSKLRNSGSKNGTIIL